jgi:hypothetical protein
MRRAVRWLARAAVECWLAQIAIIAYLVPIMRSHHPRTRIVRRFPFLGAVTVLVFLVVAPPAFAAKTDIVSLKNGDQITGEVKGLSRGKLDYSTDDVGRLAIEWTKIARVTSNHVMELETTSGVKYLGRLVASERDGLVVVEGPPVDTLAIPHVVRISLLDAGLAQQMKAYLDLGSTFAKANQSNTFTMSGNVEYRGRKYGSTLAFDSYAQGQETVPTTTRNAAGLSVTRYLPDRWAAVLLTKAEQNDELDLDLRLTAGAGAGRVLHQSNQSDFGIGGGLVVTWEQFALEPGDTVSQEGVQKNLEALFTASWDSFRFDSPKFDLSASLYVFPSLSTLGRVRGTFTTRIAYELFSDFNVGLNFSDTFDSRPPDENAATNDYVTSFTIGWSYRR